VEGTCPPGAIWRNNERSWMEKGERFAFGSVRDSSEIGNVLSGDHRAPVTCAPPPHEGRTPHSRVNRESFLITIRSMCSDGHGGPGSSPSLILIIIYLNPICDGKYLEQAPVVGFALPHGRLFRLFTDRDQAQIPRAPLRGGKNWEARQIQLIISSGNPRPESPSPHRP